MKTICCSLVLAVSFVAFSFACGEPLGNDGQIGESVMLADIDLGRFNIQFVSVGDGIIMSELGPAGEPSPLTYLREQHDATALEVYMAVVPHEDAPAELREAHERITDAAPRVLKVDDASFRAYSGGVSAANCDAFPDAVWLLGETSSLGYTAHVWTPTLTEANWWYETSSHSTQDFMTHVCNTSVSGSTIGLGHIVVYNGMTQYIRVDIDEDERSTIYGDFATTQTWYSEVQGPGFPYGQTNSVRISFNVP